MIRHPRVLVTSPQQYASRLCGRLIDTGMRPIWTPGVATLPFAPGSADARALDAAVAPLLTPCRPAPVDYVAFTSRAGIEAVMASIMRQQAGAGTAPAAAKKAAGDALRESGARVCALGADGDLLSHEYGVACDVNPYEDASTMGLVKALKNRLEEEEQEEQQGGAAAADRPGRKRARAVVLCPVPKVSHGLVEPPVVPRFLAGLTEIGVEAVRVEAYATVPGLWSPEASSSISSGSDEQRQRRAAGEAAAAELAALERGDVDAVVFSSTAEAQGLALQLYWAAGEGGERDDGQTKEQRRQQGELRRAAAFLRALLERSSEKRRAALFLPPVLLAAHGPTTAAGVAEVLGLSSHPGEILVSKDWSSFAGVTEALAGALLRRR